MFEPLQYLSGVLSGALVGFSLGLVGGGGSLLAVPLMVYFVGMPSPHVAIGTSAFAVAASAVIGLLGHVKAGTINWRCGAMYASTGVVGALTGAAAGKSIDGQRLLSLFALLMFVVGIMLFRGRQLRSDPAARCNRGNAGSVLGYGLGTGMLSGFFGIGGGFLIVPGLVASTRMPVLNAAATSLVVVAAFGFTTTISYAVSGLVDWGIAGAFVTGGILGGRLGTRTAKHMADRGYLSLILSIIIFMMATYMLWKSVEGISLGF